MTFKINLFFLFLILSCTNNSSFHLKDYSVKYLKFGNNEFKIFIADDKEKQVRGLSGIKSKDFKDNYMMLFYYNRMEYRQFWMPDTYFNLDIIFLDQNFKIVDIHRNLKHYTGRKNKEKIPTSKIIYSQYILEIKSSSSHSKLFKKGMILNL